MAKRKSRKRKKRGPVPVIVILMVGAVSCWMGLVKVDRQIRAVTINQSPPLWESREEGDYWKVTLMGRPLELDISPLRRAGEVTAEVLETPSAPVRLAREIWEALENLEQWGKPKEKYSWEKGFV